MKKSVLLGATTLAGAATALLVGASAAQAKGGLQAQKLTCGGNQELTVLTNANNSSEHGGFEAVRIVSGGSGHLIPTAFEFSAYDDTIGMTIFDGTQFKGGGHANHNQPTVTCTDSETATLGDLIGPGDELPPGASLTDEVTTTISATAVWQK